MTTENILNKAEGLRCWCQQILHQESLSSDFSIQDYIENSRIATHSAQQLMRYLNQHRATLSPDQQTQILIPVLLASRIGLRDASLSQPAERQAQILMPHIQDQSKKQSLQSALGFEP
ncbi:MAG: hypothetical protein IJ764_01220 [Bacteroidales bacterium]|nr:hypothetical protein [Bacteroidales bacterium]